MVRIGSLKYVRFRDAPPLAFDLSTDPGEQHNLLSRDGARTETSAAFSRLQAYAEESIDFDEVERERIERDGSLADDYRLDLPPVSGNLYTFPSGELVNADDPMLYNRSVLAESVENVFTRS
jgi:hypothetical protein